jgi:hypothetical protein
MIREEIHFLARAKSLRTARNRVLRYIPMLIVAVPLLMPAKLLAAAIG